MTATSQAALETVKPRIPSIKERILTVVRAQNGIGVTRENLIEQTGIHQNSLSGRITELKAAGLIVARGTRVNVRGNEEDVYFLGDGVPLRTPDVRKTKDHIEKPRLIQLLREFGITRQMIDTLHWDSQPEGYDFWHDVFETIEKAELND